MKQSRQDSALTMGPRQREQSGPGDGDQGQPGVQLDTGVCCDEEVQGWEVKLLAQVWVCDGQGWAQGHLQHSLGRDQEQGLELNTLEGAGTPSKASPSSAPRSQVQLNDSELALSSGPQRGRRGCRA